MIAAPDKRPRLGHYASIEHVDNEGIIERRCKVCGDFMVLSMFRKDANCHRGHRHVCNDCRIKQRRENGYRS